MDNIDYDRLQYRQMVQQMQQVQLKPLPQLCDPAYYLPTAAINKKLLLLLEEE